MQSHFIAGIKVGVGNDSGIIPVSSIGNGQDFDFDSAQGYIYYVEKINVSYDFSTFFSSPKVTSSDSIGKLGLTFAIQLTVKTEVK